MLESLLFVIGACGVAVSIYANITIARCADANDGEPPSAAEKRKRRALFGKPGRTDSEASGDH